MKVGVGQLFRPEKPLLLLEAVVFIKRAKVRETCFVCFWVQQAEGRMRCSIKYSDLETYIRLRSESAVSH